MVDTAIPASIHRGSTPGTDDLRMLEIEGGAPLRGSVEIGGAKNAALPLIAATLLTADECTLTNVPDLSDIHTMVDLLRALGAEVELDRDRRRVKVRAAALTTTAAPPELVARMRASFLVAGPMLARFHETTASTPGGCKLEPRQSTETPPKPIAMDDGRNLPLLRV